MKTKLTAAFCLLLLLISCSSISHSNQQKSVAEGKNNIGYECKRIKRTGSMVGTKVCTTLAQRETSKTKAKELLKESRHLQHKNDVN
ncbi:MAG: hypothetical protein KUG78_10575 [Kangiellaceae bacterium]|nr:hypothetical protein [Kangiellaceae bacterium]